VRRNRPSTLALYTAVITAAGAAVLPVTVAFSGLPPLTTQTAVLLLALLLSDVLVLHPFAGKNEVTSNASAFAFALFLTEGTTAAALGMALGSVVSDVLRKTPSRDKILFNAGQYVLAWGAAGLVFELLDGGTADGVRLLDADNITAVIASGGAFFIVNYALVGAVVALERGGELLVDVAAGWWPPSAEEIASLSIGLLIASAGISVATAPLLLLPFAAYLGTRKTETERDEALRDPLTGLVTRALFTDRAQQAMRHAERTGIGGAMLLIDLDGFKQVNDTFGHPAGDAVLREVAQRLMATVRSADTVGRLGGDEFAVLLVDQQAVDVTERIIHSITASIEQPIATQGCVCRVGASIGVARYPAQGVDLETVLKNADEDMYMAKRQGRPTPIVARRSES
jgi:diguanylate cyclase (GGDEF)-like protein